MVLWQWWWLVSIAFITVIISTIIFTYTRKPEYKTTARLIVSPATNIITTDLYELQSSITRLDKPNVANTYAEVAQSSSIVQTAWEQLGIPPQDDFEIEGTVLQQTNIIVITVTGPDPALVERLATVISDQTINYVSNLYEIYGLILLDPATFPNQPEGANEEFNLILGAILGLGAGVVCAFLADYLKIPLEQMEQMSIIDVQTGAYKSSYFFRRLREEISRSQRIQRPFVVGMIRLENFKEILAGLPPATQQILLKQVVHLLKKTLPEENLIAQRREDTLALLMPDCDLETAQQTLNMVQTKLAWTAFEVGDTGLKLNFTANIGLAGYDLNGVNPEDLLNQAENALQETET